MSADSSPDFDSGQTPDAAFSSALQQGLVTPVKKRFECIDSRLRWISLLLIVNLLVSAAVLAVVLRHS